MEYDKLCCEECIFYQIAHKLNESSICIECGKQTMVWIQNDFCTAQVICSECGWDAAVDMNTPCEYDRNTMFKCFIKISPQEKDHLFAIHQITFLPVSQVYKLMKSEGIKFELNFPEMARRLYELEDMNIPYRVEPYDPRTKYTYMKNCRYPYRLVR